MQLGGKVAAACAEEIKIWPEADWGATMGKKKELPGGDMGAASHGNRKYI